MSVSEVGRRALGRERLLCFVALVALIARFLSIVVYLLSLEVSHEVLEVLLNVFQVGLRESLIHACEYFY